MLSVQQNIFSDFLKQTIQFNLCQKMPTKKTCFTDSSLLGKESPELEELFSEYKRGTINNLQLITTLSNENMLLQFHNNGLQNNESRLHKKIISILIDQNQEIKQQLLDINRKLQKINQHTIELDLHYYNQKYRIRKGLQTYFFEQLGIEQSESIRNEDEKKEFEKLQLKYETWIELQEERNNLIQLSQKIKLINESQFYLYKKQQQFDSTNNLLELTTPKVRQCYENLKKQLITKKVSLIKLLKKYYNSDSDSDSDSKQLVFKIIFLQKQITSFTENNQDQEINVGDLVLFQINEEDYLGLVMKLKNELYDIQYITDLDDEEEIKTIKLSKENLVKNISMTTYLQFYQKLLFQQKTFHNQFPKIEINELNTLIENKTQQITVVKHPVKLSKNEVEKIKIKTKMELLTEIQKLCESNVDKKLQEDYFKTKLLPILNVDESNWKHFYDDFIKKMIMSFCKTKQLSLKQQDPVLQSILENKQQETEIGFQNYQFDENEFTNVHQFFQRPRQQRPRQTTPPRKSQKPQKQITKQSKKEFETQQTKIENQIQIQIQNQQTKIQNFMRENYLTGLQNVGNTCFMNSAIQCFLNLNTFISDLLSTNYNHTFINLVRSIRMPQINQSNLRTQLIELRRQFNTQFQENSQQDSSEMYGKILQDLHELSLQNQNKKEILNLKSQETNTIQEFFQNTQYNNWLTKLQQNSFINN